MNHTEQQPDPPKRERNLRHGTRLSRLVVTNDPAEYRLSLEWLNANGWDIRNTPRCDDFKAAAEALGADE